MQNFFKAQNKYSSNAFKLFVFIIYNFVNFEVATWKPFNSSVLMLAIIFIFLSLAFIYTFIYNIYYIIYII